MKTTKDSEKVGKSNRRVSDYVINKNLSSNIYSDFESFYPKDGLVPNERIAFKIAESVLSQIYGKEIIENEKPFSINLENNVWIIEGTLYSRKGGTAYMEIRKDNGEILKVIHTK